MVSRNPEDFYGIVFFQTSVVKYPVSFYGFAFFKHFKCGFQKHTALAIMPILASEALQRENKKSSNKMLPPVGIEPGPLITSGSPTLSFLD